MVDTTRKPDKRVARSRRLILDATRELLAGEGGVPALTIEAVAARSGVAKTTIYRRWRDKWELALDAVMIDMLGRLENPVDVGDTRKELLAFVRGVVTQLSSRPFGPAMQALASTIATEPELSRTYRERVVEPRRELLKSVIDRGIARGDLRPDTDVQFLHEFLVGPLFYRLLFSGGKLDPKFAERLVDEILEGFAPRAA
ncbi:MAG TPA: TetR/AcrR family transcriptional regulator [Gaiellaceae bacterium]